MTSTSVLEHSCSTPPRHEGTRGKPGLKRHQRNSGIGCGVTVGGNDYRCCRRGRGGKRIHCRNCADCFVCQPSAGRSPETLVTPEFQFRNSGNEWPGRQDAACACNKLSGVAADAPQISILRIRASSCLTVGPRDITTASVCRGKNFFALSEQSDRASNRGLIFLGACAQLGAWRGFKTWCGDHHRSTQSRNFRRGPRHTRPPRKH